MAPDQIIDGLIFYIELVVLLTFHEFAHAWVAHKCGDDTARLQGRLSLNPIVHIDPFGTVLFPLLMIFSPLGGYLIGWAKPVPISLANLRHPLRDDILIALAGPAMNLLLAVVLVGLARVAAFFGPSDVMILLLHAAFLSLLLCFFNLIPVPPLDGSHVLRGLIGLSWETYASLCRFPFGLMCVWLILRIPFVSNTLVGVTGGTLHLLAAWFGFPPFLD